MFKNEIKNYDIIASGMRPTGNIHIGNYNAVIKNWVSLQKHYKCFFFIADIHALTTNFKNIYNLKKNTKIMITEWLASGLNPDKCVMFIQSHVPETLELHIFLSMLVNLTRLERIPSYKNEKNNTSSYGFLGYPVLQASDVLILNAHYVPVGEDQVPHIEFIRELARKINSDPIGKKKIFNEPQALLYKHTKVLGSDGQKMSKSKNNTVLITDSSEILKNKINKYITDPNRIYRHQYGNPENCTIWSLHKIYTSITEKNYIFTACKSANIGCVECKAQLFDNIEKQNNKLIRKIKLYEKKEKYINDLIEEGGKNARLIAKETLLAFKLSYQLI
ncbi:MAG TPA: tryptophan--tRNA ligase [Candidatus Azoamicus sp. OHIO2]